MNASQYFEQEPWQRALECIQQQKLGEVLQVSVQIVCTAGAIAQSAEKWQSRLSKLLGNCATQDELKTEGVLSRISTYANGAVVRFFIDDSQDDLAENFEIVTQKALIVWKADVHPQGHMLANNGGFFECVQPYSVQLEVK